MSERIEKAFKELVDAVNDEATTKVTEIKTIVEPIVTQAVAQVTAALVAGRFKFDDLFKEKAAEEVVPPTEDQNKLIKTLRDAGKSDEEIAKFLNLNILTVKMAV
jgi:microsomal dipeptidase-like Zn-dependent dipeptidase